MDEEWRQIELESGKNYEVSSEGHIRNKTTKNILKPNKKGQGGYLYCQLYDNGKKMNVSIHRIVAQAFLEEPDNCPIVNHKDGNKENNKLENLEWCTHQQNAKHALENKLVTRNCQEVEQYSYDGTELINIFGSIQDASYYTGIKEKAISRVCVGKRPTTGGFRWKHVREKKEVKEEDVEGEFIEGFPKHKITRDGRVYSITYKRFLEGTKSRDFYSINLRHNNVEKSFLVHKLVALAFIPKPDTDKKLVIYHKNGDKKDNRTENLEWITASEAMYKSNDFRKKKSEEKDSEEV